MRASGGSLRPPVLCASDPRSGSHGAAALACPARRPFSAVRDGGHGEDAPLQRSAGPEEPTARGLSRRPPEGRLDAHPWAGRGREGLQLPS